MDELYLEAAAILSQLEKKQTSFRNLIFGSYHNNKKMLYKICYETLNRREILEKIVLKVGAKLTDDENFVENPNLLLILVYEYLFGLGLDKCAYEWRTPIESFSGELSKAKNLICSSFSKNDSSFKTVEENNLKICRLPRYARVNTLKVTLDEVLEQLQAEGWILIDVDSSISRKKFRNLVDDLKQPNFFVDVNTNDVLVFPCGTDLHNEYLIESGCLILQDKSSCFPPLCLECKPGTTVMDLCAAPGMKTSHIASCLKNQGKIFGYDKDFGRYRVMEEMLTRNGVTCAEIQCKDFLRLNLNDKMFSKVTHALLDPPCSGSGIVKRMDFLTDSNETVDEQRLKRLGNLQTVMLKHALTLPNLKRLVYSTCSVHEEENECVVGEVLEVVGDRFKLVEALPQWKHRGRRGYEFGKLCIRASPEKDRTNGFFVAVFEKI